MGARPVAVQAGAGRAESGCARCGMTWLTQASASAAGQQRVDAAQRTRLVCAAGADGAGRERARLAAADRGRAREPLPRAACGGHRPVYDHVYQRNYRQAQGAVKRCKNYRINVGVHAPPLPGLRPPLNSVQSYRPAASSANAKCGSRLLVNESLPMGQHHDLMSAISTSLCMCVHCFKCWQAQVQ